MSPGLRSPAVVQAASPPILLRQLLQPRPIEHLGQRQRQQPHRRPFRPVPPARRPTVNSLLFGRRIAANGECRVGLRGPRPRLGLLQAPRPPPGRHLRSSITAGSCQAHHASSQAGPELAPFIASRTRTAPICRTSCPTWPMTWAPRSQPGYANDAYQLADQADHDELCGWAADSLAGQIVSTNSL